METRITPRHGRGISILKPTSPRPPSHQSALAAENNSAMYKIGTETSDPASRIQ